MLGVDLLALRVMGVPSAGSGADSERIGLLLEVAGSLGTGIDAPHLWELLPQGSAIGSEEQLRRWLRDHPEVGGLQGGTAFSRSAGAPPGREQRRAEGRTRLAAAQSLVDRDLACLHRLLLSVVVTGSVAYGEPRSGDDVDLLVVCRRGTLGIVLALLFLKIRLRPSSDPTWCVNTVLEDDVARRWFSEPRGLLVAREALGAVPLWGPENYLGLLREATWIGGWLPRWYARVVGETPCAPRVLPAHAPGPWFDRLASALILPLLATYLCAVGLWKNDGLRRLGRPSDTFRTDIGRGRLLLSSLKFDELRQAYARASREPAGSPTAA